MKALTAIEALAFVAVCVGLYLGWEKISGWFASADSRVTAWVGQAPGGVQVTGTDSSGNPTGNIVPYPNPQTTAEIIANQAASGVTAPATGTGFSA